MNLDSLPPLPFSLPPSVTPHYRGQKENPIDWDNLTRETAAALMAIPGNSAKSHGRGFSSWLFFRFGSEMAEADKPTELRRFIKGCRAEGWHTSLYEQLEDRAAFVEAEDRHYQKTHEHLPPDSSAAARPFGTVLLTGKSFDYLPTPQRFRHTIGHEVFFDGMFDFRSILGDVPADGLNTASDAWAMSGAYTQTFDIALYLAANTRHRCDRFVAAALKLSDACHLQTVHRENGFIWQPDGPGTPMREPFGFRDGVSNLLFLKNDFEAHRRAHPHAAWDPTGSWDQLLYLPKPSRFDPRPNPLAGGSFVVLRKLQQNVAAFRTWESQNHRPATAGIEPGAHLIGRTREGCPLADLAAVGRMNDFNYDGDTDASRCPFHAHIRKTNPRGSSWSKEPSERDILFVRRGMIYAPDDQLELADRPDFDGNVGLLFTGYMSNPGLRFNKMLSAWMQSSSFPQLDVSGIDPLGTLPPSGLPQFVQPRGGGYFFAPPIPWVDAL